MATSTTTAAAPPRQTADAAPPPPAVPQERKPPWAPRFWEGCDFLTWIRLLVHNRFAVHWSYLYIAVVITVMSFFNSMMRVLQDAIYGRRLRKLAIDNPPIFILGHWRTGTTLLHELMILDERHSYPNTYECMEPHHFLLTENLFTSWFKFLMPAHRQMDNMQAGFDRPQEDEFALCMLGEPSPYLTMAFPNSGPQYPEYLDLSGVPAAKVRSWKRTLLGFLKRITLRDPRRLVLKSPPHTARIAVLKDMFPNALFIHIVRDPYVVFPSTVNLWRTLRRTQALQKPTYPGLEEEVFSTFTRMYEKLEEGKKLLDEKQFYELRYEELVADPVREMAKLYDHFQLGGFQKYLPRLRQYLAGVKGYETNRYQMTPQQREEVSRRWAAVIRRYGYE